MWRVSAALFAAGVAIAAPEASAQSHPASSCVPARAEVLARDRYVRVYRLDGFAVAACLVGHSGHFTLLAPGGHLHRSVDEFELAGRVVAYVETQFGVDSGTTRLVVADIAARRVLRSQQAGSYVDAGIISSRVIVKFLVTAHGSLAWTVEETRRRQLLAADVYAAARTGAPVLLESSRDIDPRSLSLSGSTLSWARAGALHHTAMP